jgi:DNA-directed RNA polymerase specialized sigma24 family protein
MDKASASKRWLCEIRRVAEKLDTQKRAMEYKGWITQRWQKQLMEETHAKAEEVLLDAGRRIDEIGGVEGELLKYKYVLMFDSYEIAQALAYSESHCYAIERRALLMLYKHLPDKWK